MLKLYDSRLSGNAWKIRLLLTQLEIPFERVTFNLPEGPTRTPEFLHKNPVGKVPVVQLDSGEYLWESNAILTYFAEGTQFMPRERIARARVMQWLFFEQTEAVKPLALPRFWIGIQNKRAEKEAEIAAWHAAGNVVLGLMDAHLADRTFFVGDAFTIADIALYTYTSLCPEGGYDLGRYPNIRRWLEQVQAQPRYVPLL